MSSSDGMGGQRAPEPSLDLIRKLWRVGRMFFFGDGRVKARFLLVIVLCLCAVCAEGEVLGSQREVGNDLPHVVMFAGPMVSHCVPNLIFARKLCAFGIKVSFVNVESVISKLKATGNLGDETERLRVVSVPNGEEYEPSDSHLVLLKTAEERTKKAMEEYLKGLMKGPQDWATPCCAIIDIFVPWVVKITKPLHINSYFMWANTASAASLVLHAPVLQAQGIIPVDFSQADKLKPVEIPCIPPLHPLDFVEPMQTGGIKYNLILEISKCILQEASGLLVNSLYEFESSVFDALKEYYQVGAASSKLQSIIPVGPLLPDSFFTKEVSSEERTAIVVKKDPVLEWLDQQPQSSVLYVSFGTVVDLSASQLVELGLGLEASDQRFIWVVRPPPGVAAINFDDLLPGFTNRIQDRGVIVTSWAPQVQILQHPATGGFLSHCGWNSVVESISGCVPMLTWPIQAEQMMNSRWLVEETGTALKVRNGFETFASRDQVQNAVRRLMGNEEGLVLRNNAIRLNEVLRKGVTGSGSSFRNIKAFAEQLQQAKYGTPSCRNVKLLRNHYTGDLHLAKETVTGKNSSYHGSEPCYVF